MSPEAIPSGVSVVPLVFSFPNIHYMFFTRNIIPYICYEICQIRKPKQKKFSTFYDRFFL